MSESFHIVIAKHIVSNLSVTSLCLQLFQCFEQSLLWSSCPLAKGCNSFTKALVAIICVRVVRWSYRLLFPNIFWIYNKINQHFGKLLQYLASSPKGQIQETKKMLHTIVNCVLLHSFPVQNTMKLVHFAEEGQAASQLNQRDSLTSTMRFPQTGLGTSSDPLGLLEFFSCCPQLQLELTPEQKNNFLPNIFESSRTVCKDTLIAPSHRCDKRNYVFLYVLQENQNPNRAGKAEQTHERHIRGWPWWGPLPAVLMHQSWCIVLRKAKIHNHLIQTFLKPEWPWHCGKITHFAWEVPFLLEYFKSSNIVKSKISKW